MSSVNQNISILGNVCYHEMNLCCVFGACVFLVTVTRYSDTYCVHIQSLGF